MENASKKIVVTIERWLFKWLRTCFYFKFESNFNCSARHLSEPSNDRVVLLQVPGQGPTSYLDAAQREKALQQMQQMSSAQIVSATAHMQPRMGPPVTYGGFWQHPGLGQTSPHDVKPFAQNPFLHSEKTPTSLGMGMGGLTGPAQPSSPAWQGRSIGNNKLRMLEFTAFVEQPRDPMVRDPDNYDKHLFVNIGATTSFSDPVLEVTFLCLL